MPESVLAWLESQGLPPLWGNVLIQTIKIISLIILSFAADRIARHWLIKGVRHLIRKTTNKWDDIFLEKGVFDSLAHLAPAFVIYTGVKIAFPEQDAAVEMVQRFSVFAVILIGTRTVDALLNALIPIYEQFEISKRKPINGYVQAVKIALYFLCIIFSLATLLAQSPWGLMSILGGMTAVLLLVFKDTILGFVASIQLVSNNMVCRGDWIEMPKYGADGDVIDISIHTVKVRNWDKTITTIPTYALISDAFKNWRGMSESGGRRIKRSICIDMTSVKFCTEEMIEKFSRFGILCDHINRKLKELDEYNKKHDVDTSVLVNGRRMTNLGCFRAYITEYLKRHPKIHQNMTFLVRHLTPSAQGLPIEIYVFSNDQAWSNYEGIQADIFDHILAVTPEFELRVFQQPSGYDMRQWTESDRLAR